MMDGTLLLILDTSVLVDTLATSAPGWGGTGHSARGSHHLLELPVGLGPDAHVEICFWKTLLFPSLAHFPTALRMHLGLPPRKTI